MSIMKMLLKDVVILHGLQESPERSVLSITFSPRMKNILRLISDNEMILLILVLVYLITNYKKRFLLLIRHHFPEPTPDK